MTYDSEYRPYRPGPPRVWSGLSALELAERIREILEGGRLPPRYLLWEAIDLIERLSAHSEPQ